MLSARGSELERDFPFAVVRQLLEPVVRDEHFAGAAALARPVLRGVGGEQDAGSALHGLYWLAANLAEERPLLVLVDDIHWADLASLRWLAYLAQRLDGLAVSLVAAARPAEAGEGQPVLDDLAHNPSIEVLEPRGLSAAAVGRAIASALGEPERRLHRRLRAGHRRQPVPARRAAARAARPSPRPPPTRRWSSARPRAPSAAPRSPACAACHPAATALARAVVILGDGAEPALAAALAELDATTASRAADALEEAAILAARAARRVRRRWRAASAAGAARAARPARRSSIRSCASPSTRSSRPATARAATRRAAQLLTEAGADAERVAIHRHEGDPAGDPEAVRVLREAAASARRRGATEVALSHLRRALREPPTPEDERGVKRELGAAELQAGAYDAAAEHLAVAAAGDPHVAVELGAALQLANRPVEAVAALSRAIDALGDDERELGLLLQATRGAASQGNRAAAELARAAGFRFGAPVDAPADARRAAVRRRPRLPRGDDAATPPRRASSPCARSTCSTIPGPGVPAVYVTPLALLFSGALVEATREFTRLLDWAREHGSFLSFVQGSHLRAGAWWRRGNLAEAEADAENAARAPELHGPPGRARAGRDPPVQDDVEGAERLWHDARPRAGPDVRPRRGRHPPDPRARARRDRPPEEALAEFLACGEMEDAWGIRTPAHSTWRSDTVRLLTTLDRVDEALALADEDVARCARRFGDPRPLGIALRAAGRRRDEGARAAPTRSRCSRSRSRCCGPRPRGSSSRSRCSSSAPRSAAPGAAPRRATRCARRSSSPPSAARPRSPRRAHDELVAAGARPRRDPIESRSRLTASEARVAQDGGRGHDQPRDRAGAVPDREDDRGPPHEHLPQARHRLALAARRALSGKVSGAPPTSG